MTYCLEVYMKYADVVAIPKTNLPVVWRGGAVPGMLPRFVATMNESPVPTFIVETPLPCWTSTPTATLVATDSATPIPPVDTPTQTATITGTVEVPISCLTAADGIALPGAIGGPGYMILSTDTPTPTPTSVAWNSQGVIASDADWASYCAMVSLDPAANPAPADFSTQMIIFWGHPNYSCPIVTSIDSVCRYDDRWQVTLVTTGGICYACPMWYIQPQTVFTGFVVNKSDLPLTWAHIDKTDHCGLLFGF
jgi:hypothetical protein